MDITVLHAELSKLGGQQVYVLTCQITHDDGEVEHQWRLMPHDVFEWRAAEYGINATTDTGWRDLLAMVLFELHLTEAATPEEQLDDPDHLYNAATVAAARKARMDRIRKRRGKGKLTGQTGISEQKILINEAVGLLNSGAEDPLEFIRRTAPMSTEHMQIKAECTRRIRGRIRARRAGRDPMRLADLDAVTDQARADTLLSRPDLPAREAADVLASRLLGGSEFRHETEFDVPESDPPRSSDED